MRGGWPLPRPATNVTARPRLMASSGVMGCSLATPRTPSVPNRLRTGVTVAKASSFGRLTAGGPDGHALRRPLLDDHARRRALQLHRDRRRAAAALRQGRPGLHLA